MHKYLLGIEIRKEGHEKCSWALVLALQGSLIVIMVLRATTSFREQQYSETVSGIFFGLNFMKVHTVFYNYPLKNKLFMENVSLFLKLF